MYAESAPECVLHFIFVQNRNYLIEDRKKKSGVSVAFLRLSSATPKRLEGPRFRALGVRSLSQRKTIGFHSASRVRAGGPPSKEAETFIV